MSIVASLLRDQFPELDGVSIVHIGEGWDNEAYLVDDEWIFRFPRRAGNVAWLEREVQLMPVVATGVTFSVPRFEKIGERSAAFPYPFVGYRMLPGVLCDQTASHSLDVLAEDLGAALTETHAIDPGAIARTPTGWEEDIVDSPTILVERAPVIRPLLPDDVAELAAPYLAGEVTPPPAYSGPRRFLHNDLGADHILIDADTSRLTGIIDWADMIVGDPAREFVGLISIGPFRFIQDVLRSYRLPVDDGLLDRVSWSTRVAALSWLGDTAFEGAALDLHLGWVRRAFETEDT